jgi:polyhydroxyalkanoate synthesis regulator phasin
MIVGTTAGLLSGAGVGLLFAVPSFTNAASTDSSSAAVSAAVVAQDGTTTDDTTTDATDDADRPEPGVELRAVLQPLVDDGTITAAQADAVTAQLVANRPEGGHGRFGGFGGHGGFGGLGGHRGFDGEVIAGLLGIDVDTLRTDLQDGKTIAEIATEQGVDVQTVIDALVTEAQTHLDQAVTDGRLTEDEAATKLAEITTEITDRVNNGRPASD